MEYRQFAKPAAVLVLGTGAAAWAIVNSGGSGDAAPEQSFIPDTARNAGVLCMVVLHRNRPGGLRPRGLGEKQKRRAGQCLHSVRRDPSSSDTAAGTPQQNHPLQERPDYRIIFHAVRPDGRCVGGISTCAGFRVLAHSETAAFSFFTTIIAGNACYCKRESRRGPSGRGGLSLRITPPRSADARAEGGGPG